MKRARNATGIPYGPDKIPDWPNLYIWKPTGRRVRISALLHPIPASRQDAQDFFELPEEQIQPIDDYTR